MEMWVTLSLGSKILKLLLLWLQMNVVLVLVKRAFVNMLLYELILDLEYCRSSIVQVKCLRNYKR